jgi:transaldolase
MKPKNLQTKIFLDSGNPEDTREVLSILGFLDGQTTNPSLVAQNPEVQGRISNGNPFTREELMKKYTEVIQAISAQIPNGSVSIEVYADGQTSSQEMLEQAHMMYQWVPNAHIKLPTTEEGLKAAWSLTEEGIRINMTLVFSQAQAAAVYSATFGARKGDVFLSPFIGRLEDQGQRGIDLIKNTMEMYRGGDGHVEVLAASIRTLDHLKACFAAKVDIVTVPKKILIEWADSGFDMSIAEDDNSLAHIPYETVPLGYEVEAYDIKHELTDAGLTKFALDWNKLIG